LGDPLSLEESRAQTRAYLERAIAAYDTLGLGFYATIYKPEGQFIGRCGLLLQILDEIPYVEVAYGISPAYWGRGLATEAARGIKEFGFRSYAFPRLVSIVDRENIASQRVAEKNGMYAEKMLKGSLPITLLTVPGGLLEQPAAISLFVCIRRRSPPIL
jgi:[ribosomal protein S5]-alanine N-acetyltransferase